MEIKHAEAVCVSMHWYLTLLADLSDHYLSLHNF